MSYPLSDGVGLGADLAAQRTQLLTDAFNRGDSGYLMAWISDVPAHPRASVALAQQLLAKLNVPKVSSGSIAFAAPGAPASQLAPTPYVPAAPPPPDIFSAPTPDGGLTITSPVPAPMLTMPSVPTTPLEAAAVPSAGGLSPAVLGVAALAAYFLFGR